MARMIPADIDPSTLSDAERRIFALFQNDTDTTDWVVLHALGLSRRGRKPYGEIDFVVLIPHEGVLCLEVKGGRIACLDGQWEMVDRHGRTATLNRSPFLQAREGMFALRDAIGQRAPPGFPANVVFAYAVVMPDIQFGLCSPEWEPWQVIDHDSLRKPLAALLRRIVREHAALYGVGAANEPGPETMRTLKQLLRPDFERVLARTAQIEQTEQKLLKLTEEQYATLDLLTDNDRCLVQGAAGTGKTMLAQEFARRAAVSGYRTLFICFNRLLGDWLDLQCQPIAASQRLTAGSFHKLLREVILHSPLAQEFLEQEARVPAADLFTGIYYDCGKLALEELDEPYDVLVVDEAQDLLSPGAVEVLDCWLRNGLVAGRWAIFGDFHRQAIFGTTTGDQLKQLLVNTAPQCTRIPLTVNCRNSRNIGEETALLSGFAAPPYRMGQMPGLPVDYRYFRTAQDQQAALGEVLRRLLADGVKASDIVVLSPYKLARSRIAGLDGGRDFRIAEVGEPVPAQTRVPIVRFATAQAFKGMESVVVVMCDVERVTDQEPQSLLYVAMSRARAQLIMLVDENLRNPIADLVRRKLEAAWR